MLCVTTDPATAHWLSGPEPIATVHHPRAQRHTRCPHCTYWSDTTALAHGRWPPHTTTSTAQCTVCGHRVWLQSEVFTAPRRTYLQPQRPDVLERWAAVLTAWLPVASVAWLLVSYVTWHTPRAGDGVDVLTDGEPATRIGRGAPSTRT